MHYHQVTLKNGLTLITVQKPGKLFSLNLGLQVGSLMEGDWEKGICHFIEHMLFKGTVYEDNETLNRRIEMMGGDFNAYTDYISTVYSVSALREELPESLNILHEMIAHPAFSAEEMEKERGVILSEMRSALDDPEDITHRNLYEKAYATSPLRYDVIGTEESIGRLTAEDLQRFHHTHYVPGRAILILVSSYSHEEAGILVEKTLGQWQGSMTPPIPWVFEKNLPGIHTDYKDMEQSTLAILYSFPLQEEEKLPLRVLNYKLGQSGNSILFRELREKRGLAYDVYSDLDLTENIQNLVIYTQVSDESLESTLEVIQEILEDIKTGAYFHQDDLNMMKKVMKTSIYGTLDSIHDLSAFLLDEVLNHQDPREFEKDMAKLEKVTLKDLVAVSQKVFSEPTIFMLRGNPDDEDHTDYGE